MRTGSYTLRAVARLMLVVVCCAPLAHAQSEQELMLFDQKIDALESAGKFAEAIALAETAAKEAFKAAGNDRHDAAVAHFEHRLGMLYKYNGDLDKAELWMMRATNDAAAVYGASSQETLHSYAALGSIYGEKGDFAKAEQTLGNAVKAMAIRTGDDSPDVAECESLLGQMYLRWEKPEKAKPPLRHAAEIYASDFEASLDLAYTLSDLGQAYRDTGELDEAGRTFEKSLRLEESAGAAGEEIASTLDSLGTLRQEEGRFADAENAFRRALSLRTDTIGLDHPAAGESFNNLGNLYLQLGDLAKARPLIERALALKEKALGAEHPEVAIILNNLADVEHDEGRLAEAEALYKRVCAIEEKSLGAPSATSLNNLGLVQDALNKHAEAESALRRAMSLDEKRFGHESIEAADDATSLATVLEETGNASEAETLLKGAVATLERRAGKDAPNVAPALNALANVYVHQGKYAQAEPLFVRALKIDQQRFGGHHPYTGVAASNLANVYDMTGQAARAFPLYRQTVENLRDQLENKFSYMPEDERLTFVATTADTFDKVFSFCLDEGPQHAEFASAMFDLALWRKGMVAASIASLRARIAGGGSAKASQILDQLQQKKTDLARAASSSRRAAPEALAKLQNEVRAIERELEEASAVAAGEKRIQTSTWQDVQHALTPGDAAVEFVFFHYSTPKQEKSGDYYAALVIRPGMPQPSIVPLGWADEMHGAPMNAYRKRARLERDPTLPDKPNFYDAFWLPLRPVLGGAKRVYIAADGMLNTVAWNVVAGASDWLAAEYDLRLVVSTRDLVRSAAARVDRTAMLVADPQFISSPNDTQLPQLPETRQEVLAIADQLHAAGWTIDECLGREATKDALKLMKHPRIVHIATHAFFEPQDAQGQRQPVPRSVMFRSGLYLTGARDENGVLTAYEASTLDLHQTELVVLSGCQTGEGDIRAGEGVFGVRRALQEAGAESILMSMWEVRDDTTRELMTDFYARLMNGEEKHEAFRDAQADLARELRARWGRDLPEQWGAFVLVGR